MVFSNIKKWTMSMALAVVLTACSSAKTTSVGARSAEGLVGAGAVSGTSCKSHNGRIYESTSNQGASFEQRVKGLISATVDPSYFGAIEGSKTATQTCVAIEGRISYDVSSGAVNLSQSNLKITIYDSFVGTNNSNNEPIEPYVIQFTGAAAGRVIVAEKSFNLQFKDEVGEINLTGNLSQTMTTGNVSYQNYENFNSNSPASGFLGDFSIPTASFAY
ncbi:MAG: hypothetical protein IPM97_06655 [Bdellovibrionaceae bacterium]|nr:hypothetical protein [Pseudobdellovibrionaceae bacterium]